MPAVAGFFAGFQLAPLSIVTSSTSDVFRVFNIPHMYWSTSRPSNWAGLLQNEQIILDAIHTNNFLEKQ